MKHNGSKKSNSYRQVYDSTCATWMNGFQSLKVYEYGGDNQWLTAYSTKACLAGEDVFGGPVSNKTNALAIPGTQLITVDGRVIRATESQCYNTKNHEGGANSLGSRSL